MVHAVHSVCALRHAASIAGLVHRDWSALVAGAPSHHAWKDPEDDREQRGGGTPKLCRPNGTCCCSVMLTRASANLLNYCGYTLIGNSRESP